MTQDDLFPPDDPEPVTFWERLGAYLLGECDRPPELGPGAFDD